LTFSHIQGRIDIPKQGETMLGYTIDDINEMINAIHDSKLFYIRNSNVEYVDRDPLVHWLLKTKDLLDGLIEEGHVTA
jgi:hypothetical protein